MKKKAVEINFIKMTGAGNDFVLIDNRNETYSFDWSKAAVTLCNRRYGVGADGLLVLERSTKYDFTMLYFNADGSSGGMCGNGGRCASFYVMNDLKKSKTIFEAVSHEYSARANHSEIYLQMLNPKIIEVNKKLNLNGEQAIMTFINTGAPHAVFFMNEIPKTFQKKIAEKDIKEIGATIRHHKYFSPEGTNVDFIDLLKDRTISMRTYERGVEDETLACGTGAVASAVAGSLLRGLHSPISIKTRGGEMLRVKFQKKGDKFSNIELHGSAKIVFKGTITL